MIVFIVGFQVRGVSGAVVMCSTLMRKVVSLNPHPDMEALGKASYSPAHWRHSMAAPAKAQNEFHSIEFHLND